MTLPGLEDEQKVDIPEGEETTPVEAPEAKDGGAGVVDTPPAAEAQQEEEFDEVVYNREVRKIPKSERKTYLQKGLNYDKVYEQHKAFKSDLEEAAKLAGYTNVDEFQQYLASEKKRRVAEEKGVSPEVLDTIQSLESKVATYEAETKFTKQKEELKDAPFFKENEAAIMEIAAQVGDVAAAHAWFVAQNLKKLTAKQLEDAKKQAIEDYKRAQSKGGVLPTDGTPNTDEPLDLTPAEKAHGERRVAQGYFKDLREYHAFLRGQKGTKF